MALIDNIPSMPDAALTTLLNNARRIETTGTAAQRQAAIEIIPAVANEIEKRQAEKKVRMAEAREAAREARKATATRKKAAAG